MIALAIVGAKPKRRVGFRVKSMRQKGRISYAQLRQILHPEGFRHEDPVIKGQGTWNVRPMGSQARVGIEIDGDGTHGPGHQKCSRRDVGALEHEKKVRPQVLRFQNKSPCVFLHQNWG